MDIIKIELQETKNESLKISNNSVPFKNAIIKEEKEYSTKESEPSQEIEKYNVKGNNCFQCKVCPYNTFRKPFLDKHMIQKHSFLKVNDEKKSVSVPSNSEETIDVEKGGKGLDSMELGCKQCNFKTTNLVLLNIHEDIHENKDESYQCIQCKFKTEEVSALRNHEKIHKKLTLFNCLNCDYATRQKCNLRQHLRVHEDPKKMKRYTCTICKKFMSFHYSTLLRHLKLKHNTDGEDFKCDMCPFTTKIQSRLTNHKKLHKTHDDMPMFKCEKCDFLTYNEATIQRHVQRHEDRQKDGEEVMVKEQMDKKEIVWFCCNMCSFRSKEQRYVILHKKVHSRVDEINKVAENIVRFGVIKTDTAKSSGGSS